MMRRSVLGVVAAVALAGCSAAPGPSTAPRSSPPPGLPPAFSATGAPLHPAAFCPALAGGLHCDAMAMVDPSGAVGRSAAPVGATPAELQAAYGIAAQVKSGGVGQTVGVVGSYDNPTLEQDMNHYRATFGLPSCTSASGCFRKVDENGQPETAIPAAVGSVGLPGDSVTAIGGEASLDVDMVSAACPNCHIIYVEAIAEAVAAGSSVVSLTTLAHSANTAARLGAQVVTSSYGVLEGADPTIPLDDHLYNTPGTVQLASSGDGGFGVEYPASSPYVIAVGGTTLSPDPSSPRGYAETAWGFAGSGCSPTEPKPAWQRDPLCLTRSVADVSADADPRTGVAVYDTYGAGPNDGGWLLVGGTSASSPLVAGMIGLAGNGATMGPGASYLYAHASGFRDIQGGQNKKGCGDYTCRGDIRYDGPTGLGSPKGLAGL